MKGVFWNDAGDTYSWDKNGTFHPFDMGDGVLEGPGTNGNYCTGDCEGYDPVNYTQLRIPLERQVYNLNADYQVNDHLRLFTELTYSHYTADGISSPVFHQGVEVSSENPFLSDEARAIIDADGGSAYIYRMDTEFGDRTYNQKRETKRALIGADGYIGDWNYSVFYQEGRLDQDTHWYGQVYDDNYLLAIDAVSDGSGNIVCRDQSNGCQPLNIFGEGQASQAAIDWVSASAYRKADAKQKNAGFTFTGPVYELPAGPVNVALSGEWRREEASTEPDANMQEGRIFGNQSLGYSGAYEVNEWAAEVSVPLVEDVFLMKQVGVEMAYRYMDYTSVGNNDAWKLGLNWAVTDDLKLRATKSKSVRAPSVEELYQAAGQTYESFTDVCDANNIDAGDSPYRKQNCQAVGLPEGWSASDDWYHSNHPGYNAGNADLKEETSDAWTMGFVYTPSFLENFSLTADWWSFDIANAITSIGVGTAVKYCYDSESLDNPYCSLFTRDASGDIVSFVQSPINVATYKTKGLDIEANYSYDTESMGLFSFNLIATYLDDWRYNPTGFASDLDVYVGEYTDPRWKGRFTAGWHYADWSVSAIASYRGSGVLDNDYTAKDVSYNNIPSQTLWDMSAKYQINDDLQVRFGVLNVFDQEPPRNPYTYDNSDGYYDTNGRSFFAGINYTFR
ncbi:TonB-dependent receptor domain-containing protein [Shewanella dokdonensis]|uniref:TonB-dependent receptor domain-containing protein n=1 Tax=Shewanella dokdonensis TaxID=712036 RepID=UPI001FD440A5|nr:TonB-dependent receptor [Shewanella dokdonensis]